MRTKPPKRVLRDSKAPTYGERFDPFINDNVHVYDRITAFKGISPGAKLAYHALLNYRAIVGEASPALKRTASSLGMSSEQARRHLNSLVQKGFVEVELRHQEDGTQLSNRYHFLWHPCFEEQTPPRLEKTKGQ